MGIPKFYRWLSERYPLVNQPIGSNAVPIIDNLYLDMNGIIHNCTHGNDPGTRLTEPEMIARIFTYLDRLFQIVQPQKLLFMAIDGVAPRAKMNQQRSRRFKSAREAQEAMEAAQRRGEPVPEGEVFDSNCITPGTAFMGRLGAHLRFFLRKKIAEDPAWQRPNIVFSGHDVPGEGEHKIMEYIRWQKLQPNYPPNLRHCMYGLDADLIMLSLVTHDPHFCLLREVVSFSGGARGRPAREVLENPSQEHFILFQIGLLRDYLTIEFRNTSLPFQFDTERIIDDFVLFCMLIGNDFLPALPTLDIAEGALDKIFGIYKQLLPAMGGYLTEAGALNRPRLELLLQKLAGLELEVLEQRAEDAEAFDNKRARRGGGEAWVGSRVAARRANELDEEDKFEAQLAALGLGDHPGEEDDLALLAKLEGDEHDERPQEPTMMSVEARRLMLAGEGHKGLELWKDRYYREKLRVDRNDPAGVHDVVHSYITGLHWVLDYYYRGVASWNWFYPYHFAPMVSDMVNIEALDVRFEYGKPFLPFDQLLAVLPSASCKLLPQAFEALMKDPQSPIIDFYPPTFRVDMEGKRSDWEGVVLIPFIDQERLLQAAASVAPSRLSAEERERNKLGDILIFSHDPKSDEQWYCASTLPTKFSSVVHCNSRCKREPPPPPLPRNMSGFVPRLVPGTKMGPGGPAGFPTLSTLSVTPQLKAAGVEVFGQPSKKESLILQIKDTLAAAMAAGNITAIQVADTICGQRCWIKWPYMQEAIVQAVSDKTQKVDKNAGIRKHDAAAADEWWTEASKLGREFVVKHGMDVGRCEIILHVRPVEGLIRQLDGSVEKRFSKKELLYPIQATLRRNPTPDPRFDPASVSAQLAGLEFGAGSKALFLGRQYYGCVATVLPGVGAGLSKKGQKLEKPASTTLHVEIDPAPVTAAQAAQTAKRLLSGGTLAVRYEASGQVARKLGVSARTLGRITSNVWLQTGEERVDVGIFVKHGSKSLCVPDYVQPAPGGSGWMYSEALCNVLSQYKKRHTWVFRMVEDQAEAKELDLAAALPEMTPDARIKVVSEAKAWLKTLPLMRRPLVKTSSQVAPEQAIRAAQAAAPPPSRPLPSIHLENVAPALLLPPAERGGVAMALAGGVFELGDRVASIRATGTPPFGLRGTVVGVHEDACEVLFDADFLGGNDLHGRCNGSCGLIIPADQLLNLSKPQAIQATGPSAPKVVRGASQAGAPTAAGAADSGLSAKQAADAALAGLRVANGAASGGAGAAGSAAFAGPVTGTGPVPPPLSAALKFSKAEAAKQGESSPARRQPAIPPAHGSKGFAAGRGRALAAPNGQAALEAAAPGSPAASPRAPTGNVSAPASEVAQTTQYGQAVVTHDEQLDRTSNSQGGVSSKTAAQLQALDIGTWFAPQFAGQRMLLLPELLQRYRGQIHLHLELKSKQADLPSVVAQVLQGSGWLDFSASGPEQHPFHVPGLTITSFHLHQLQRSLRVLPGVRHGWLVQEITDDILQTCQDHGISGVYPRANACTVATISQARLQGCSVRGWGVKTAQDLHRLLACGAQGTTVDWPDKARDMLQAADVGGAQA
ncbi:hypothetical protein WJX72_011521 [[Myrmecia] bisecta]|uniref:glycerophosphodiester phosphodiesterase n=1 Tax=[Myrmecia] bisecta TaxID=41462 RepID=A0AAW1Q7X5_9CHLO